MLEGHLLNDRYKILKTIGGGGMANVYLAEDTILEREVAIKVLRLEYSNNEEFIARFDREAQAATSLSHPNIVNMYDVGEQEHILYMVMEYVNGLTLKEYIQRYGPIEVEEALSIMKQITSAIAHAHANNLVHRDIKPQNILMDQYGNIKVTDFGIAIALSATSLTQTNSILGSVHYLSPEQARGGMATKKSDIYSLGIVFYELLTGRLPFSGQTPVSIALKHLQNDTPSVKRFNPDIPQSVENIVLKATAKDPFHRYETVYELETALDSALHPSNINNPPFIPPIEPGEETKVIPIITDHLIDQNANDDTIPHQGKVETKKYASSAKKSKETKKIKKKKEKKKSKKKALIVFLSFFVILAVLSIILIPGMLKPKEEIITDTIGWEYDEAKEELEKLNFVVEKELVFDDEIEENHVVKTDPKPGRTAKVETVVTLFVSEGKEKTEFEDYVGKDFSQTKRLLEPDYKEIINWDKHSDKPLGEIITQIQPEPGEKVVPEDTQVIFEVSAGPELITLNNLKGMTEEEVKEYLDSKGLKMNRSEDNSVNVPVGNVITQDPSANAELSEGSTVDVTISIGPKADPPVFHSVTFTVPYKVDEVLEENTENEEQPEEESGEESEEESVENTEAENDEKPEEKPVDEIEPVKQKVLIYIGDMKYDISEVFKEDSITKDTEYTITLTIAPNSEANYKVMRDDEVVIDETKSY